MHVVWSTGDEDLAKAYLVMEGFQLVTYGQRTAEAFRCAEGWECRIQYANADRLYRRALSQARRQRQKEAGQRGEA